MNLLETRVLFQREQRGAGHRWRSYKKQTFFFKTGVTYANFNLEEIKSFNLQTTVSDITVF